MTATFVSSMKPGTSCDPSHVIVASFKSSSRTCRSTTYMVTSVGRKTRCTNFILRDLATPLPLVKRLDEMFESKDEAADAVKIGQL